MSGYWIVSDTHLGSPHCRAARLLGFLDGVPADVSLILNGDILDFWRPLPSEHAAVLDRLRAESAGGREVIWIRGNNDAEYHLPHPSAIRFESWLELDVCGGVYVAHGHDFNGSYGRRLLTWPFRLLYGIRHMSGAPSIHAAQYARRWRWLFDLFNNHTARHAVRQARSRSLAVAVCGHTHFPQERILDGVRYLNSGCWTEDCPYYVEIRGSHVALLPVNHIPQGFPV